MRKTIYHFVVPFLFCISIMHAQTNIDTSSFNAVFNQLNLKPNTLVVIGEAHTIRGTHNTELLIIKHLMEKGYKTLFIEGGEAEATLINLYLKTGDTTVLKYTRAREPTGEQMKFMKGLYKLKEKHPALFIKGFDFEHPAPLQYLFSNWFDTTKIKEPMIREQVKLLQSIKGDISYWNDKQMKRVKTILDSVANSLLTSEPYYKTILGENYINFKNIILNPVSANFNTRDKNMKKVALHYEKETGLDNCIFIAGSHHVIYWRWEFIPLLSKELPQKYDLTVIPFIYKHCRFYAKEKTYTYRKKFLKHLSSRYTDETVVRFSKVDKRMTPITRKNTTTVITEVYNQ